MRAVSPPRVVRFWSRLLGVILLCGVSTEPARAADNYPSRPIRIIVGFAPGGNTDVYARLLSAHLQKVLGQPVVVENKSGAASILGIQHVATSKPDGYTLCFCVSNVATNRFTYRNLPYKPDDLTAVGLVFNSSTALIVPARSEFDSVGKMIAYAQTNPGKLSYSTTGAGGATHLITELFRAETGVSAVAVHYKGAAPATLAALSGEVDFAMSATATALPHLRTQKIRALSVNTPERLSALPDVPTIGESGYPGVASSTWYGVLAPAGTPREIIVLLNKEINVFSRTKTIVEKIVSDGDRPRGDLSPQAFAKYIIDDAEVMRRAIEPLSIRLD